MKLKIEVLLLKLCIWVLTTRHNKRLAAGMRNSDSKEFTTLGFAIDLLVKELGQRNTSNLNWRIVRMPKPELEIKT